MTSKIFDKLILKRINEIQDQEQVDLKGKQQHSLKKSTATLGLKLQSFIERASDKNNYALMASLNLSAALIKYTDL